MVQSTPLSAAAQAHAGRMGAKRFWKLHGEDQPDTQAACVQMHSITSTTSSAERNFAAFKKTMQDRCTILFK
jgi:hypothetical protein